MPNKLWVYCAGSPLGSRLKGGGVTTPSGCVYGCVCGAPLALLSLPLPQDYSWASGVRAEGGRGHARKSRMENAVSRSLSHSIHGLASRSFPAASALLVLMQRQHLHTHPCTRTHH